MTIKNLFFGSAKQNMKLCLLGPACLLLGLFCVLLKSAHGFWPLFSTAVLSFFCIWKWKKIGFCLSLALLCFALGIVLRTQDVFWATLLAVSIGLSGLLLLLGWQEMSFFFQETEEEMLALKEDNEAFLHDLNRLEAITSRDQTEMAAVIDRFKQELHAASLHNAALEEQVAETTKEKQELSSEISSYQRKEKAFQHALEDAQNQLRKCKYEMNEMRSSAIAAQEEVEDKSAQFVQAQYAQLKEQFDEKSEVLHQTRKELFAMESALLALQKAEEERACSEEDISPIQKLYAEHEDRESQIEELQDLISLLVQPKKSGAPRKRKNGKEAQEDLLDRLLQEKISDS